MRDVRLGVWAELLAALLLAACGGAPPPKPAPEAPPDPQPESVEWLHATPGGSGILSDECKVVDHALEAESSCTGSLCKYAVNLGHDWLHVCPKFEHSREKAVAEIVSDLERRVHPPAKQCEVRAESLLASACRESKDCRSLAEIWALQCGAEFGTPLVLRIIEREVQRVTGSTAPLDTTSCDQQFDKVTASLSCANEFDCNDKVAALDKYRVKCEPAGTRVSPTHALREGQLLSAAGKPTPPIALTDGTLASDVHGVRLADGTGIALTAAGKPLDSLAAFVSTLKQSEYLDPVFVAKVFRDGPTAEMRFGTVFAAEAADYFKRYAPLALAGQVEARRAIAETNLGIALGHALERTAAHDPDQPAALADLVAAASFARSLDGSDVAKRVFASADSKIVPLCEWVGREKGRLLSKITDKALRVAATQRNDHCLFADVDDKGAVSAEAVTDAIFFDDSALVECGAAYRKGFERWINSAKRASLSEKETAALSERIRSRGNACGDQRDERGAKEQAVIRCAFGFEPCDEAKLEAATQELDDAVTAVDRARRTFEAALHEAEPATRAAYDDLVTRCFE